MNIRVVDIDDYLATLASAAPTPGGGSAATIVGAMAAALVAMVARITLANAKYAERAADAADVVAAADALRAEFVSARIRDERAYAAVVDAMALPKGSGDERAARTARLQDALGAAAAAPLEVAALSMRALTEVARAHDLGNANLVSDVACAAYFSRACFLASLENVRINHRFMKDRVLISSQERALSEAELAYASSYAALEHALTPQ